MINELFLISLATLFAVLLTWAFRTLPNERWQIVATVPIRKENFERWTGLNFTFYGVFLASAYLSAVILFLVLTGALGVSLEGILSLVLVSLVFCFPASWLLAVVVERKKYTFTVGGAVLVGLLISSPVILFVRHLIHESNLELMPVLAAMCVSYLVGEGLGRLACISFGCCYGKPVDCLGPTARRLLGRLSFTFTGPTKKISYESGLDGVKVVPIQAITAALLLLCALVSIVFYLRGHFHTAFALSILFSQSWRVISETLRADFRGGGRFSAYQKMGIVAMIYAVVLLLTVSDPTGVSVELTAGLSMLWQPGVILVLQLIWIVLFIATGCSMVTSSTLSFHVRKERT